MAQAAETAQSRPSPLNITPKARKRLTPFRERTFRAMYEAALADGGADIIESAEIILDESDVDPDRETALCLVCWVDGSHKDAMKIFHRMAERATSLWASLAEAERKDWVRWITYDANPIAMIENSVAPS